MRSHLHIDEQGLARDRDGRHLTFAEVPHLVVFIDYRPCGYMSKQVALTTITWADGRQLYSALKERAIVLLPVEMAWREAA